MCVIPCWFIPETMIYVGLLKSLCAIPCFYCFYNPETEEPGCICPIPCCFGVPIPNIFAFAGTGWDERGEGNSWIFRDGARGMVCECIVVDKESGMINVYGETPENNEVDYQCCTCVPVTTSQILTGCSLVFGLIFSFIRTHANRVYKVVY